MWPAAEQRAIVASSAPSEGIRELPALIERAKKTGYPFAVRPAVSQMLLEGGENDFSVDNCPLPLRGSLSTRELQARLGGVLTFTANGPRIGELLALGVKGVLSDYPNQLRAAVERLPGVIDGEGLIDASKVLAYGHRGARGLRPENTLPAIEAALDHGCNGIEVDVVLSKDGVPLVGHDGILLPALTRRADGTRLAPNEHVRVRDFDAADLQRTFVNDLLKPKEFPEQRNDPALSPVAVDFASSAGMPEVYTPPTLGQLFRFLESYAAYYRDGAGRGHPEAARRARSAETCHVCIEAKVRAEEERRGDVFPADVVADTICDAVMTEDARTPGFAARATLISFNARSIARAIDRGELQVAYDFER